MKIKNIGEKYVIYETRNACGQRSLMFLLRPLRRCHKVQVGDAEGIIEFCETN